MKNWSENMVIEVKRGMNRVGWVSVFVSALVLIVGVVARAEEGATGEPVVATGPAAEEAEARPIAGLSEPATRPVGECAEGVEDSEEGGVVGWLEIHGALRDSPPPFAWVAEDKKTNSLRKVVGQLRHVAGDKASKGVVIRLDQAELEMAQVQEISAAVRVVRESGKKVAVYSEAYDPRSYLLACSADLILLQHKGLVELTGLGVEEVYLAGLLEKVGLKADFLQVGKYKGADEMLTRRGPSREWSQNMDALLDDLYGQVMDGIGSARKMDRREVLRAFADSWTMSDEEYVKRGLVDRLVDMSLTEVTGEEFGESFVWDEEMGQAAVFEEVDNPFALFKLLFKEPSRRLSRPTLAVVHLAGAIHSGESSVLSPRAGPFGGESVGSNTIIEALTKAKEEEMVKGVVLRIDSPGGSALASEVIWQGVRELGEKKPVYVSVGGMAASGGYYIASAGHEIYATDKSIVGSIGVVGGKIVTSGLYEKIGVTVYRRSRGPMGDLFNSVEPFTLEQKAALRGAFERTYEQFLDRVRTGRGSRVKDLDGVAQGRIFTGNQAARVGLVDKIGGQDDAVGDLAKQVGLEEGKYDVVDWPGPISLAEYLDAIFSPGARRDLSVGGGVWEQGVMVAAEKLLGPGGWRRARAVLGGLMLLQNERVLALMPAVVNVR